MGKGFGSKRNLSSKPGTPGERPFSGCSPFSGGSLRFRCAENRRPECRASNCTKHHNSATPWRGKAIKHDNIRSAMSLLMHLTNSRNLVLITKHRAGR